MKFRNSPLFFGLIIIILFVAAQQSLFIVHQTQRALVLQLGKPVGGVREPGLHFKLPMVQNVVYLDARVLDYDAQPAEILTADKKNLVVDNFSKWRIVEPLAFYTSVRTVPRAQARLDDIVYSDLREALGRYTLNEIVSTKRDVIMRQVTKRSNQLVSQFGIEVIDVRIKRADLPPENERAIFGRMRAERERTAKQYRSEGREEASKITAMADRESTLIVAEAGRKAAVLRGEGDAQAISLYAEALKRDPKFYEFQRSLEAYQKALSQKTRIVLTPDSPFLQHFE